MKQFVYVKVFPNLAIREIKHVCVGGKGVQVLFKREENKARKE